MTARKCLLIASALLAGGATAQTSDADLRAAVEVSLRAAGERWSVSPEIRVSSAEGRMRSLESGRIDIPLASLRAAVAGAPDDELGFVIGWLMAHETGIRSNIAKVGGRRARRRRNGGSGSARPM
jgi:hypothetical protein